MGGPREGQVREIHRSAWRQVLGASGGDLQIRLVAGPGRKWGRHMVGETGWMGWGTWSQGWGEVAWA